MDKQSKMKILIISHSAVVGSYQEKLSCLEQKADVELFLITPKQWPECGKLTKLDTLTYPNIKKKALCVFFTGHVYGHFYRFSKLLKEVSIFKPDLIYFEEEPHGFVALQIALISVLKKIKFGFFTWENIDRRYKWLYHILHYFIMLKASFGVCGNRDGKNILKRRWSLKKLEIIPQYGVNTDKYKSLDVDQLRSDCGLSGFTIGFVGRFVEEKGITTLMKAFVALNEDISLVFIGSGPMKSELESFALKHKRIKILGNVDNSKMPQYMNCLDLLILPSLTTETWKEQFGWVLIEAMACGVPTIGSSSGDIPNVIGVEELIFEENNSEQLKQRILFLYNNKEQYNHYKVLLRNRIVKHYTNKHIANQLHTLFKEILKK